MSTIDREHLDELKHTHRLVPITRTLFADAETPVGVYRKLAGGRPGTFLLESAEAGASFSRWSFVGVGAVASLGVDGDRASWTGTVPAGVPTEGDPLEVLGAAWRALKGPRLPDHADSVDLGALTVGTWTTAVTATPSSSSVASGQQVSITAHVARSYGDTDESAAGVSVKLVYRPAGATRDTTVVAKTAANGSAVFKVRPKSTTTFSTEVSGVTGYADGTASDVTVTVP